MMLRAQHFRNHIAMATVHPDRAAMVPDASTPPAEGGEQSNGASLASRIGELSTGMDAQNEGQLIDVTEAPAGPSADTQLIMSNYEVSVTLADQQLDPNSPLYSIKTFEELGLHPNLLKGIYNMKFSKPSKIQERALPLLLSNPPRNMIAQSQSGTGKTAAFALTMLSRVDFDNHTPQALCLAPSRELARQIQAVVDEMGQFTPCKTFLAVKDGWDRSVKPDAHIVIGTPGTVMDMLNRRCLDPRAIRVFALDEADEMLDAQSLGEQSMRVRRQCPPDAQILLFSATFPPRVQDYASKMCPEANEIRLKKEELSVDAIQQLYMDCADENAKFDVLVELYELMTIGQSIIFCRLRETADRVAQKMIAQGHSVASLHGDKLAGNRDEIIDGFREGKTKVLITTNVIARGIDIQQVNLVINYDIPTSGRDKNGPVDTESYLHRIGRTGRFGRKGIAILFVHDENSWHQMESIKRELGKDIVRVGTEDLGEMEKAIKKVLKASTAQAA